MDTSGLRRRLAVAKLTREDGTPAGVFGVEHLFVGSVGCIMASESLRMAGITHTLCVGINVESPSNETIESLNLRHLHVGVEDRPDEDITRIFHTCFDFIELAKRESGRVLVYCFQGKSRSVTVALAYLMKHYGLPFLTALDRIRSGRPSASPNLGFILQLRKYEKFLLSNAEES